MHLAIIMSNAVRMSTRPTSWPDDAIDPWAMDEAQRVGPFLMASSIGESGLGRGEVGNIVTKALQWAARKMFRRGRDGSSTEDTQEGL